MTRIVVAGVQIQYKKGVYPTKIWCDTVTAPDLCTSTEFRGLGYGPYSHSHPPPIPERIAYVQVPYCLRLKMPRHWDAPTGFPSRTLADQITNRRPHLLSCVQWRVALSLKLAVTRLPVRFDADNFY